MNPRDLARKRDETIAILTDLDDHTIRELHRRNQHPATDGYPSNSLAQGTNHPGGHSDPTATKACQNPPHDPIGTTIRDLFAQLAEIHGTAKAIDRARNYAMNITDTHPNHQPAGTHCQACERWVAGGAADPIRRGLCEPCHSAWRRAGSPLPGPDFNHFRAGRQPKTA